MENPVVACYLCQKYKATFITNSGVPICGYCNDDLHEDAPKGEEKVKSEFEKKFKGSDVELSINGQKISPFTQKQESILIGKELGPLTMEDIENACKSVVINGGIGLNNPRRAVYIDNLSFDINKSIVNYTIKLPNPISWIPFNFDI
jgi:hypothetical protein